MIYVVCFFAIFKIISGQPIQYYDPANLENTLGSYVKNMNCQELTAAIQQMALSRFSRAALLKPLIGQIMQPVVEKIATTLQAPNKPLVYSLPLNQNGPSYLSKEPLFYSNVIQNSPRRLHI